MPSCAAQPRRQRRCKGFLVSGFSIVMASCTAPVIGNLTIHDGLFGFAERPMSSNCRSREGPPKTHILRGSTEIMNPSFHP